MRNGNSVTCTTTPAFSSPFSFWFAFVEKLIPWLWGTDPRSTWQVSSTRQHGAAVSPHTPFLLGFLIRRVQGKPALCSFPWPEFQAVQCPQRVTRDCQVPCPAGWAGREGMSYKWKPEMFMAKCFLRWSFELFWIGANATWRWACTWVSLYLFLSWNVLLGGGNTPIPPLLADLEQFLWLLYTIWGRLFSLSFEGFFPIPTHPHHPLISNWYLWHVRKKSLSLMCQLSFSQKCCLIHFQTVWLEAFAVRLVLQDCRVGSSSFGNLGWFFVGFSTSSIGPLLHFKTNAGKCHPVNIFTLDLFCQTCYWWSFK